MCSIQAEWPQEGAGAHLVAPSHTFSPPLVKLPGTGVINLASCQRSNSQIFEVHQTDKPKL
ncbi:uncharacterized protein N7487_003335 [Penicillium crustosum]|uniref:uncharacterized protein n=1 Tax=Penicillium crustosum TaxID=36656 RepID=UPI0023A185D7|nr:uncharacterized protein N7487_003335 [Penicillium crustosum]KAJ5419785.1 hypothetical protein N7487_003335 [Penicillium crustosum]